MRDLRLRFVSAAFGLGLGAVSMSAMGQGVQAPQPAPQKHHHTSAEEAKKRRLEDSRSARSFVEKLYVQYAWEAVVESKNGNGVFDEDRPVLAKYFDEPMVALILRDRTCGYEICNLDFEPLWDSQDPSGATVDVKATSDPLRVEVVLRYRDDKETLVYKMTTTSRGWRISDIQSNTWSLVSMLSRPLDAPPGTTKSDDRKSP